MKLADATSPIQPNDIDTKQHFWDAFGKMETELTANWLVRYFQAKELPWGPFNPTDVEAHYAAQGKSLVWNGLLEDARAISLIGPALYQPTLEFAVVCARAAPKKR